MGIGAIWKDRPRRSCNCVFFFVGMDGHGCLEACGFWVRYTLLFSLDVSLFDRSDVSETVGALYSI